MKSTNSHAPTLEILTQTLTALGRLGKRLARIIQEEDHRRLTTVTINPKGYRDWRDFFVDYSCLNLVKKYPFLRLPGVNPKSVAEEKFRKSETRCREVNFMFSHPSQIPHSARPLLVRARREVRRILGVFSLDDIVPYLSHGPGATYRTRKAVGHPWYKFGDLTPTVTGECLTLHNIFTRYSGLWDNIHKENGIDPKVVAGSKVTTVPKDAKCDRIIAIEPLLNMFYQKGIGGLMRSRLRKAGCNLNDQTTNQGFAKVGSMTDSLATIDLSSASDSVSRGLVEYLLPPDWLQFLNATRSNYTTFSGETLFLQKYSSMGNGFTFELESLIFLALCRAVASSKENVISVYGDDIIVSRELAPSLIELLNVCGFTTNIEKTFLDGPFRESCGKHYFLGHDVTPLYVKADIQSEDRYLWYLNSIRRLSFRLLGLGYGCCDRLKPVYTFVYQRLRPMTKTLSIPEGFGDGGVVRDFDECSPRPKPQKGQVEGFTTRHLTRVYAGFKPTGFQQLLVSLFNLGFSREGCGCLECDDVARYFPKGDTVHRRFTLLSLKDDIPLEVPLQKYKWRVSKLSVPRWPCLGPWVSRS